MLLRFSFQFMMLAAASILSTHASTLELKNFRAMLLADNLHAFSETDRAFQEASGRLVIFSYYWRGRLAGKALAYQAIQTVRRGVGVDVVVDGFDYYIPERARILRLMAEEGVHVHLFRPPIKSVLSGTVWKRFHEKCVFSQRADGSARIILGGRNRDDHYYLARDVFDLDVALELDPQQAKAFYREQIAAVLRAPMLEPWSSPMRSLENEALFEEVKRAYDQTRGMLAEEDSSGVDWAPVERGSFARNRGNRIEATKLLLDTIVAAKSSLSLANAYFIPTAPFVEALGAKLKQGIPVSVFSNSRSSTNHPAITYLMEAEVDPLLKQYPDSFLLYLRNEGELHAKAAVVDDRYLAVGSLNLDPRSERDDTQNLIVLDSPVLSRQVDALLSAQLAQGRYTRMKESPQGAWSRCARLLLSFVKERY